MSSPVRQIFPLVRPPWPTVDPFLFCVHHLDAYPEGDESMAVTADLRGRSIGADFSGKDGWSMYHGQTVPGFPRHPHRGFETVTVARNGYIDHSDSLGATARFGHGDAQWMTAGKGIVHSEMFPLVHTDAPNPTELFQVWINLPAKSKMVEPHFAMLWSESIPRHELDGVVVTTVAGALNGQTPPNAPPHSWASQAEGNVAIWTIEMQPGSSFSIPATDDETGRVLYFFEGQRVTIGGEPVDKGNGALVRAEVELELRNVGETAASLFMLQGRPIGEPVAHHGPFVMNTRAELQQAMVDYRRTEFGGWPWKSDGPVHARTQGRFAKHIDGRLDVPEAAQ